MQRLTLLILVMILAGTFIGCSRNYNYTSDKNLKSAEEYYFKKGMDSLTRKNAVEAVPNFSEVIRINPKNADAYYHRARIYTAAGFEEQAKKDIDSAKTLSEKYRIKDTIKPLGFELSDSDKEILKPVAVPDDAAIAADKPSPIDN